MGSASSKKQAPKKEAATDKTEVTAADKQRTDTDINKKTAPADKNKVSVDDEQKMNADKNKETPAAVNDVGNQEKPQNQSSNKVDLSSKTNNKQMDKMADDDKKNDQDAEHGNKKSKEDSDEDWHGIDLANLMQGLELSQDKRAWEKYCDDLINRNEANVKPDKKRKGWKTVRLFVSSTFKDFNNERDYLVKKVFPRLREWCEERKLRLIECDLRWGVPKDADTRETLMTCLSEIDRCREENGYPYFLSMLSERYGWVPDINEVPDDIRIRYKWMPGMSVTTSEIMVGGYWERNKHALYLLRTPEYLDHVKNEKIKSHFVESDPENKHALQTLKDKIQQHYPEQVYSYSPQLERENKDSIVLSGLEEMGERVLTHFKMMLEQQYPADNLGQEPSTQDQLRIEHETFMFQRSQVLLGRDENVREIQNYINSKEPKPLILLGYPGSGKSALMAYNVKKCLENEKLKVFYHFVGATPGSTDLYLLLLRMFLELMPKGRKAPEDDMEMKRFALTMFEAIVQHALEEGYTKIVIFLDALNQMDDEGDDQKLLWLPRTLPHGMKLVVSTLEGKCLDALRSDGDQGTGIRPLEHSVDPLDKNIRKAIVEKILSEYNKKLDDEQLEVLTSKNEAGKPLWLTVACEELRVFGQFRKLTDKVKSLPPDMTGLLEVVLRRVVDEYGQDLVMATLCLVETSRFGLLETELLNLLAIQPTVPGAKHVDGLDFEGKLPMAKWALVYVGLRQFLRPCGSSGEGRLDFHHRTISKSVRHMYLSKEADKLWWHKRLAEYFETSTDMSRKAEELPYHLELADNKNKLREVLLSHDLFSEMYKESNKQRLMKYWLYIGGYKLASEEYVKSLHSMIKNNNLSDIDDYALIQTRIAWFLSDIGEYNTASELLTEVIDKLTKKHGDMSELLADPLHCMIHLLYMKALQYVYSSHPGYRECSTKGKQYATQGTKLFDKMYASSTDEQAKRKYGRILVVSGYFIPQNLQKAVAIFESIQDNQGMAQVLYMSGEKEQYNRDLSVPTKMFTMSMKLCLSVFGKVHLHTARCAQLHGQMYWNNMNRQDFLVKCLALYQQEVEILAEIQGAHHPNTVRSREDVIIILQTLGRNDEANVYLKQQPSTHDAVE